MIFSSLPQAPWFRRVVWPVGLVLLSWALAWVAVPLLLKHQLETVVSTQLGRSVSVGQVEFKPWSLELTVRDLVLARAPGGVSSTPQFSFKRFYIDIELQSLLRLAPVVDALVLEGVHLNLTHLGQGHYDIDDMVARLRQAPAKPDTPDETPLRFALYNLALAGGSVDFTDATVNRTHMLRNVQLALPFLSNLDSQRTVQVQPHLAFSLNGSQFDSRAAATPFAQMRKADAHLKLEGLDLAPYLDYLPASLPVRLRSAVVDADLQVAFEQTPAMAVKLRGTVQAHKVRIVQPQGADEAPLLAFDRLRIALQDVRPLEQVVHLSALELQEPVLDVHRESSGSINLTGPRPPYATKKIAENAQPAGAEGKNVAQPGAWRLALDKLQVSGGRVHWQDDMLRPSAHLGLVDVALDASAITWPFAKPMLLAGSAGLDQPQPGAARLTWSGQATDQAAQVTLALTQVPLDLAAPYLAEAITPTLQGSVSAELGLDWQRPGLDGSHPGHLRVSAPQIAFERVALAQGRSGWLSIDQVQLEQAQIDLDRQSVRIGTLRVHSPRLALERAADGLWMFERWHKASHLAATQTPARGAPLARPWGVILDELALEAGALHFQDKMPPKPVALELAALALRIKNFSTTAPKPFSVHLATNLRAAGGEVGRLRWRGSTALAPLKVQGQLDARRLPLHALEPYLADMLNIELLRAEGSFQGRVNFSQTASGPVLKLQGDTLVEDFQAHTLASSTGDGPVALGEELLRWKLLQVRGLELAMTPGTATQLAVRDTVLSDFFARVILSEKGELNLADLLKKPHSSAAPTGASNATVTPVLVAEKSNPSSAEGKNNHEDALAPVVRFGPISLLGGTVHFSDRFIQPNYSANVTELTGKLSAFSSQRQAEGVQLADLELRGRAQGTAALDIRGKVNPLARPLALDIKGQVRDLELPPLSPYAVRYAGYGIERGKLHVEVSYQVQPDGKLTAQNNIVLNQLTFGDKVEGAPASLPVKLAVALLADRRGVIDINLPISGSLSDPQFRLGPLVFKLIVNLIGRAITSPFSLLASAFGGGADELGVVAFAPGSARLDPGAKPALEKVAKALLERPALRLTVVGMASQEAERGAYQRAQLQTLLRDEKRRARIAAGSSGTLAGAGAEEVDADEYPALLKAVYRRADFPRPRNLLGMLKDIPVSEMEALLLAHIPAGTEAMQALALQRSVVVRDYLASLQLPTERLFLGAAKTPPSGAKWSPRAELNLAIP